MGPSGEGLWLPCGVNPVIKFARYRPGCLFKMHADGPWAPGIDHMSVFSIVMYLYDRSILGLCFQRYSNHYRNSGYKGGETRFFVRLPHLSVISRFPWTTICGGISYDATT